MDVVGIAGLLHRQRRIVVPAVVLALVSLVAAYKLTPPQYKSSGALVLLSPPAESGTPTTVPVANAKTYNPYLTFNTDLGVVVALLQRKLTSAPVSRSLHAAGLGGSYVVQPNIAVYSGPILDVNATDRTPARAARDLDLVMRSLETQLVSQQEEMGVPPQGRITATVVSPPSAGTRVLSSALRRLIAVAALDTLLVLFLAVGAEALTRRRLEQRERLAPLTIVPIWSEAQSIGVEGSSGTAKRRGHPTWAGTPSPGRGMSAGQ